MSKARLALVVGDWSVEEIFRKRGWRTTPKWVGAEPDIIVFTGGEDISPALYDQVNVRSWFSRDRDELEVNLYEHFRAIPKVGICRGGQLLNVLSGGSMWQDCNNHGGTHTGFDWRTGGSVSLTSVHHQLMRPSDEAVILCTSRRSSRVEDDTGEYEVDLLDNYVGEMEALWYPNTESLCFQGHPEYGNSACEEYFFSLVDQYVGAAS